MILPIYVKLLLTILAAIVIFLIGFITSRLISKRDTLETSQRRKFIVAVRDLLSFCFILLCIWLWYPQLKTIATTLAVIAVAIAIALKEFLLNITGFLFRSSARNFTIGDRIELSGLRGDVVDSTIMGVSIMEIGPGTNQYTGRTVFIPNSEFLSVSVKNETRMRHYVFHNIIFPLNETDDWEGTEKNLLEIANEIVAPYIQDVNEYILQLTRKSSLEAPAVEPRIYIQMPEREKINLVLRMPVPIRRRGRVEQEVIRKYLQKRANK